MEDQAASYNIPALRTELLAHLGPCAADYPQQVEQHYPRILARLVELWGGSELEDYLNQLVFTERTGRQGFPQEVAVELFRLSAALQTLGLSRQKAGFGWNSIALETRDTPPEQPVRR